jgi:hypothetical protein
MRCMQPMMLVPSTRLRACNACLIQHALHHVRGHVVGHGCTWLARTLCQCGAVVAAALAACGRLVWLCARAAICWSRSLHAVLCRRQRQGWWRLGASLVSIWGRRFCCGVEWRSAISLLVCQVLWHLLQILGHAQRPYYLVRAAVTSALSVWPGSPWLLPLAPLVWYTEGDGAAGPWDM